MAVELGTDIARLVGRSTAVMRVRVGQGQRRCPGPASPLPTNCPVLSAVVVATNGLVVGVDTG